MTATELIVAIAVFLIAGITAALGVMSFMERGPLLNNAFIYSSEEERKKIDKAPYYRQSAIIFCLVSVVFIIIGLSVVLQNPKIALLELPVIAVTAVYAVVSAAKINNKKK
ncbi:MAG: DUF3784 domain-containing protein [Clostridia bacterium]|nr:DUF3784 domain-containing protein [Clostridia bacterium]